MIFLNLFLDLISDHLKRNLDYQIFGTRCSAQIYQNTDLRPILTFLIFLIKKKLGGFTLFFNRFLELIIKNIGKVRPWLCNMGVIVSSQGLTLPRKSPTAEKK